MAELACELSPLVYSEYYRMLAGDPSLEEALAIRVRGAGLDDDWLEQAASAYEAKWDADRQLGAEYGVQALTSDHAEFASWILAGVRPTSIDELGTKLSTAIAQRLADEMPEWLSPIPSAFSPVILGWTFGMVVDAQVDPQLPAIPAQPVRDSNIAAAYQGLVQHVVHLGPIREPWPEVIGTSTFVRGAGIAESLRPGVGGPHAALNQLMADTRRAIPPTLHGQLTRHWTNFVKRRNSVVHIRPYSEGEIAFADVMDAADSWDKIRLTVRGITEFVFHEVALELADPRSKSDGHWKSLGYDLVVDW